MSVDCQKSTSGGKGNLGRFTEKTPKICAAGLPTAQSGDAISEALQHYLLKDEVDSLISDAIIPPAKPPPLPPLRHPIPRDMRNAGLRTECADLINPPIKNKFESLVEDLKNTTYSSYWKQPLGTRPDPIPMFPDGFDISGTIYGKKNTFEERLYDIVMPKEPLPDLTPASKGAGAQISRNYCDTFHPDRIFGRWDNIDKRGNLTKCCLTYGNVVQGNAGKMALNVIQANHLEATRSRIGTVLAPIKNIRHVPEGYSFGVSGYSKLGDNFPQCNIPYQMNPDIIIFRRSLAHLNSLRKKMSTRFLPTFFSTLYLNLKYFDTDKSGWLQKEKVYEICGKHGIRLEPASIEPLLILWNAFDGSRIEFQKFVLIINYKQSLPVLPKIPDFPPHCIDYNTTYTDMTLNVHEYNTTPAGLPSGRYFDEDYPVTPPGYCLANRTDLPHESDMKSCINPSVLTQFNVSHRDMYSKREPHAIRRIFEAAGENFTDQRFNDIWKEAKKYHSDGWVCFETFRRALRNKPPETKH